MGSNKVPAVNPAVSPAGERRLSPLLQIHLTLCLQGKNLGQINTLSKCFTVNKTNVNRLTVYLIDHMDQITVWQ